MEIKAVNVKQKEITGEEDFFLSYEVFVGPINENYVYEVYDFNVISIKKLYDEFPDNGVMLNKGWMIMKFYDEEEIKRKIEAVIAQCIGANDDETYLKLNAYLRIQEA